MHTDSFRRGRSAALVLTAASIAFQSFALAAPMSLLPLTGGDLRPSQLVAAKSLPALPAGIERSTVQFAWALSPGDALERQPPFRAESRGWYAELDGADLEAGTPLALSAPGAVLRLSPLAGTKAASTERLEVLQHGRRLGESARQHASTSRELAAAGAKFAEGTVAFRLDPSLGSQGIALRLPGASGRFLLHVHEPASPVVAQLQASRDHAFAGTSLQARLGIDQDGTTLAPSAVRGALVAPDGRVFDVAFDAAADGSASAAFALPDAATALPGLWELHAFAAADAGGERVLRDTKTSFAVVQPTARLGGDVVTRLNPQGFTVDVALEVASPGRYELRGVLYGSAADGSMRPFAIAHAARWLETSGSVALVFDAALLAGGLAGPWELRHLELADQARMARLETRERALRIEAGRASGSGLAIR